MPAGPQVLAAVCAVQVRQLVYRRRAGRTPAGAALPHAVCGAVGWRRAVRTHAQRRMVSSSPEVATSHCLHTPDAKRAVAASPNSACVLGLPRPAPPPPPSPPFTPPAARNRNSRSKATPVGVATDLGTVVVTDADAGFVHHMHHHHHHHNANFHLSRQSAGGSSTPGSSAAASTSASAAGSGGGVGWREVAEAVVAAAEAVPQGAASATACGMQAAMNAAAGATGAQEVRDAGAASEASKGEEAQLEAAAAQLLGSGSDGSLAQAEAAAAATQEELERCRQALRCGPLAPCTPPPPMTQPHLPACARAVRRLRRRRGGRGEISSSGCGGCGSQPACQGGGSAFWLTKLGPLRRAVYLPARVLTSRPSAGNLFGRPPPAPPRPGPLAGRSGRRRPGCRSSSATCAPSARCCSTSATGVCPPARLRSACLRSALLAPAGGVRCSGGAASNPACTGPWGCHGGVVVSAEAGGMHTHTHPCSADAHANVRTGIRASSWPLPAAKPSAISPWSRSYCRAPFSLLPRDPARLHRAAPASRPTRPTRCRPRHADAGPSQSSCTRAWRSSGRGTSCGRRPRPASSWSSSGRACSRACPRCRGTPRRRAWTRACG